MGVTYESHACSGCPTTGTTVKDRGKPFGSLCDRCFDDEMHITDDEQALADGALAPAPPAPPTCPTCGTDQDRLETGYGRYVLLEPRAHAPIHQVPEGQRWIIGPDGTAINWRGLPPSAVTCRFAHHLVCAHAPKPTRQAPALIAYWTMNRDRAGLPSDE